MNFTKKINGLIEELDCVMSMVNLMGSDNADVPNHAMAHVINVRTALNCAQEEINTIEGKKILAEAERDSLLMAIAGTIEGRTLDITEPRDVIQHAVSVIRIMDADIRANREVDEMPFGAVEQDQEYEKFQLEKRIVDLELQLESKVDESNATENHLREYKARWISLINLINKLDHTGVNIAGSLPENLPSALLNTEAVIFRRGYCQVSTNAGVIIYADKSSFTDEMKAAIAKKNEENKGAGNFKNMFINKPNFYSAESDASSPIIHELKILPEHFEAVAMGVKTAEIRQCDRLGRGFAVGDVLLLREWDHEKEYTGNETYRLIKHVTDLKDYAPGYVMLSIVPMREVERKELEEKYIEKYRAKRP